MVCMGTSLELEKLIWDENDFEHMGWHDAKVYAVAFMDESFEFVLDIDYVLEWIHPKEGESNFKFWVAPSTLVFRNVWDLNIDLEGRVDLEILDLHRGNLHKPKNAEHIKEFAEYDWRIETDSGEIAFKSAGYKQYFRKPPALLDRQRIGLKERGGISFDVIH